MLIRPATFQDVPSICEIENHEIATGYAHFGLVPTPLEQRQSEFLANHEKYPWLVAESNGVVTGYARANPWKARGAYAWTAEIGVYVSEPNQGKGIGRSLYARLFPILEASGLRTIMAGIALPNPASVRLHESFGMKQVALMPKMGYKLGDWWDVGYWSLHFGEGPPTPQADQP